MDHFLTSDPWTSALKKQPNIFIDFLLLSYLNTVIAYGLVLFSTKFYEKGGIQESDLVMMK